MFPLYRIIRACNLWVNRCSSVQQVQGDRRLGLEGDRFGDLRRLPPGRVTGPLCRQVQPGGDRPSTGPFGVVGVDGNLAVAHLPQRAGVLAGHSHRALPLLGEAGVVDDQDTVPLAGQFEHLFDALAVEVVLVPGHGGEQALKSLLGGTGNILGDGIAVLVGQFGQKPSQVAFQRVGTLATGEMDPERIEERGQLGHRLRGSLHDADGCVHTPLYGRTPQMTKSYYPELTCTGSRVEPFVQ